MKRRLFFILGITFCFTMGISFPAFAWHFSNVELSASCDGFDITGNVATTWPINEPVTLVYTFSLNGVEIISGIDEFEVNITGWAKYPFEISGFWNEDLCGVVTGGIVWVSSVEGDTAIFEPLTFNCVCGEGCSPGYWKNHEDAWNATGFSPYDDFDTIFGVDLFDPDITLYEAVWAHGGHENRLARHGTAALLNASHGSVGYPLSESEVIYAVQAGNTDALEEANELGCPFWTEMTLLDDGASPHLGSKENGDNLWEIMGIPHFSIPYVMSSHGQFAPSRRICIADVNGDGLMEIVVSSDIKVHVFYHRLSEPESWPGTTFNKDDYSVRPL